MDSSPNVGKYSSLAIRTGFLSWKLGIAYIDETNHALKYYSYSCTILGCNALIETIDSSLNPARHASLKFDSGGTPHIAYQGSCGANCSRLKYASYSGSGGNCGAGSSAGKWQCDQIDGVAVNNYGLYASLDLNGSNRPRIAYYDGWNGDLRYAWDCAGSSCGNCGPNNAWQCDVLDATGNVGLFPSLHIDKGGSDNPRIAYYDSTNGKLKLAGLPGTIGNCGPSIFSLKFWQCDNIDNMGAGLSGYAGVSLAIDKGGMPVIAYMDASEEQSPVKLKVARKFSMPEKGNCGPLNFWDCRTVDGGGSTIDEGSFAALAFAANGKGIIAYYEEDSYYNGNLKIATTWDKLFLPLILK